MIDIPILLITQKFLVQLFTSSDFLDSSIDFILVFTIISGMFYSARKIIFNQDQIN
jgi:hypothetical protein